MTATEAAMLIGCTPQQVRTLIRTKKIKAKRIKYPGGYYYQIQKREALRYHNKPQTCGFPRGKARKKT